MSAPRNELKPTMYWDGQVGWAAPWNAQVTVGVRNLFDTDPPLAFLSIREHLRPCVPYSWSLLLRKLRSQILSAKRLELRS